MIPPTADLCDGYVTDAHGCIAQPIFRDYGCAEPWGGRVRTVKVYEDNALVRATLQEPGTGAVLVIDGGGSQRCALVGDQLAKSALENGWAGIVVFGCVRDSATLATMPLGIKAIGTHPLRSSKKGLGERDIPVAFAGVKFALGDFVFADRDGLVVVSESIAAVLRAP